MDAEQFPEPSQPEFIEILRYAGSLTLQKLVFRRHAKREFFEWLETTYPDRPAGEDDERRFGGEISKLARRIYREVATNDIPIPKRRYCFDPQSYNQFTYREDPWNPPRKFSVLTLNLIYNSPVTN